MYSHFSVESTLLIFRRIQFGAEQNHDLRLGMEIVPLIVVVGAAAEAVVRPKRTNQSASKFDRKLTKADIRMIYLPSPL